MLAIARAGARNGHLARMYTSLHTARLQAALPKLPHRALRRALEGQLARRSFAEIPPDVIEPVAQISQALHVLSMRIPHGYSLASWLLYDSKKRFDRAVSRKVAGEQFDAVVTLDFSAARTFQVLRDTGALRVLDFIDSHPRYQNRYLRELCGLRDPHRELVFPEVIGRIENELELADLVLVPSRFVARQLETVGIRPERVVIERFGVDASAFHPPDRDQKPRRDVARCLFVGQISYRKGVSILIEAARRLRGRPVEFQLVGPMVSPEVVKGMPENAHWRGARLQEGVGGVMREADLFVLPSVEDAFGLVTLEAMASALPVIVTDHVGASELISNREQGLIVPAGDAAALAQAIEQLLESDLRAALGRAARALVEERCSWDRYGDNVLTLIRERLGAGDENASGSRSGHSGPA
jgi:glycosyltransferase involved in cell wall biosynthesis